MSAEWEQSVSNSVEHETLMNMSTRILGIESERWNLPGNNVLNHGTCRSNSLDSFRVPSAHVA